MYALGFRESFCSECFRERESMKHTMIGQTLVAFSLGFSLLGSVTACAGTADTTTDEAATAVATESAGDDASEATGESTGITNGTYAIEVDTDSSMFHADSCQLIVEDGTYSAVLVLPGEGFSRLYFGTAEEAASADDADIYDFYLNDEGKYTFDIPVAALDEELTIAAFGHRRDTWYDHTITFHTPADDAVADAE